MMPLKFPLDGKTSKTSIFTYVQCNPPEVCVLCWLLLRRGQKRFLLLPPVGVESRCAIYCGPPLKRTIRFWKEINPKALLYREFEEKNWCHPVDSLGCEKTETHFVDYKDNKLLLSNLDVYAEFIAIVHKKEGMSGINFPVSFLETEINLYCPADRQTPRQYDTRV